MKKLSFLIVALAMVFTISFVNKSYAGITIDITMPTVGSGLGAVADSPLQALEDSINSTLNKYGNMPLFVGAMATANAYTSPIASLASYQGYDLFAISFGTMIGIKAPTLNPSEIGDSLSDLDNGDIEVGAALQTWSLNIGINAGFLMEDLYLSVKFGKFNISASGAEFNAFNFGLMANYQLFKKRSLLGLVVWRGLSLGTGLVINKMDLTYAVDLSSLTSGSFTEDVTGNNATANFAGDPSVNLLVDSLAVTIPFEASTAVRLLYFLNLSIGVGLDFSFGGSEVTIGSKGDVRLESTDGDTDLDLLIANQNPGSISIEASTEAGPQIVNPRIMAGIGICAGPVTMIDFTVAYYIPSGLNLGLAASIIW